MHDQFHSLVLTKLGLVTNDVAVLNLTSKERGILVHQYDHARFELLFAG